MLMFVNIYLFLGTWQDMRTKKIRNWYLWLGGIMGLAYKGLAMIKGTSFFQEWALAMIPGLFLLLIAKVTKENIGYGDGWVLLILGNFFSLMEILSILQIAVFFVMICSLALLCSKKVTGSYQIPFLPFLWGAHILLWGIGYV